MCIRLLSCIVCILLAGCSDRQTYPASAPDWIKQKQFAVRHRTIISETSSEGEVRYFIKAKGSKINLSPADYKAYKEGRAELEIVRWYNPHKDIYRYTARRTRDDNESPGIKKF